jgi:uncharacterized LabA/DUF88 family protein
MKPNGTTIYIDGENLLYGIVDVLVKNNLIKERAELIKFDLISLFLEAVKNDNPPIDVRYYGTKVHVVKDMGDEAKEQSQKMVDHKKEWDKWLETQKIQFITAGNLKARQKKDGVLFVEKGVDVTLAVDMVMQAYEAKNTHFVIVSSDSDVIPALRAIKKQGHKITYVGYKNMLNKAIVAHADNTITYSKNDIINSYKSTNK